MPVTAPALKAMPRPLASPRLDASVVRTLARTDTSMPMNPAVPDSTAPIRKPMATGTESRNAISTKITAPTMAIVVYWRVR